MTDHLPPSAAGEAAPRATCPTCRQPVVRAEIRTIGGNFESWHYEPVVKAAPDPLTALERAVVEAADEMCPPDGNTFPIVFAKLERLKAAVNSLRDARAAGGEGRERRG